MTTTSLYGSRVYIGMYIPDCMISDNIPMIAFPRVRTIYIYILVSTCASMSCIRS